MFKVEQIHKKIKDGYKYWAIVNADNERMEIQARDITPDESCNNFNEFCKTVESGTFSVVMWNKSPYTTAGTLRRDLPSLKLPFRITAQPEPKEHPMNNQIQSMSGFENVGGPLSAAAMYAKIERLEEIIKERDKEIQKLERKLEIKEILDNHAEELRKKEGSIEQQIMGIAGTLAPDLLKSFTQKPINGISDDMAQPTDAKARILAAVNKLIEKDPNFTDNIEKLAKLADKNPAMYAQAAKLINSFI